MTSRAAFTARLACILAAAAALYLVGNHRIQLWDRDEPRYAECSREMLQSGDWVVPRFLGELRAHKPPLIYWCQAASMEIFGQSGAAARLPSALAVVGVATLLGLFVRRVADARRALWSVLVFCTCALTIAAAKLCITDAVLLLFIGAGQGCLYVMWRRPRVSLPIILLFWFSTALAGLTKGPVVLAMHGGTLLVLAALERREGLTRAVGWWRRIGPIIGLVIVAAVVTPWLVMVHSRAPEFLPQLMNRAGRYAGGGAEGHAHWPGFYLVMIWGMLFPWSLLLPTSIGIGIRYRSEPLPRFALAAAIGPWIVMELVTNKLPFYILPCFPALAILTAEAIVRCGDAAIGSADDDLKRRSFLIGVAVWGLAVLGLGGLPLLAAAHWGGSLPPAVACAVTAAAYLVVVLVCFVRRRVALASGAIAVGMAVLAAILFAGIIPGISMLSASRRIGNELNALGAGAQTPVAMIDYREPSLAFYQGGGARESDIAALASARPPHWAVLTSDAWQRAGAIAHRRYQIVGNPQTVLTYNDGRRITQLLIIRVKQAP